MVLTDLDILLVFTLRVVFLIIDFTHSRHFACLIFSISFWPFSFSNNFFLKITPRKFRILSKRREYTMVRFKNLWTNFSNCCRLINIGLILFILISLESV